MTRWLLYLETGAATITALLALAATTIAALYLKEPHR